MKRLLLLAMAMLALTTTARAWGWWNYPPDNEEVTLTSTNLPIVWLDVDGQYIDRYERITAQMKIIHNGEGQLNYADTIAHPGQNIDYEGYVAIRYRGSSSFSMSDKKPYSFRPLDKPLEEGGTKKKVNILGMGKDNDWALLAPYADKSMMRDLLAFEVSRPWMEYTPQGRYCELFLDGTYYGVYILTETVSKGKHRINLSDPGLTGDSITGGYIMEVNRIDDEVTYTSKYHPVSKTGVRYMNQYINFQYKSPDYEDLTQEQVSYITGRIDQMEQSLWNYNSNNNTDYGQYIDVTNFIDYQIAMELGHNVDAYRLSGKFFKRRDSEDQRFKMVVWDMNLAYGNSDYYEGWRTDTWMYQNNNIMNSEGDPQLIPFWWYKLNTDPNYVAALKSRWAQYRRSNLRQDRVMATVDSLATVLTSHGAEHRNSEAWPRWGEHVWPNYYVADSFQDEVAYVKEWLTERIVWMDSQLDFDPNASVRGDVDGNGRVNINDVTALINYLLGQAPAGVNQDAADCDLDGGVSISDVTMLINFLLLGHWEAS
jgi:spore coat protein CotH